MQMKVAERNAPDRNVPERNPPVRNPPVRNPPVRNLPVRNPPVRKSTESGRCRRTKRIAPPSPLRGGSGARNEPRLAEGTDGPGLLTSIRASWVGQAGLLAPGSISPRAFPPLPSCRAPAGQSVTIIGTVAGDDRIRSARVRGSSPVTAAAPRWILTTLPARVLPGLPVPSTVPPIARESQQGGTLSELETVPQNRTLALPRPVPLGRMSPHRPSGVPCERGVR